jgi:hypothetical protein
MMVPMKTTAKTDHAASFIRFAAARRATATPRGDVVKWCAFQHPMLDRPSASLPLPVLRNRHDVRSWRPEADGLWTEFTATLDADERTAARSGEDIDAPDRQHRALVDAWLTEFGTRPATARELADPRTATSGALDAITGVEDLPSRAAAWIAQSLVDVAIPDCRWMVAPATPDRHAEVKRWRLAPIWPSSANAYQRPP